MYAHINTLTKRLATTNTHNTLTSHANTTAQIPKMAKLLTQIERHHGTSAGDNMDIDYILRASHMTLLTWPTPTNPIITPSTPTNPPSPHISHTLTHPPIPTSPNPPYPPPIYSPTTDDHSTATPTPTNATYLPPIYSMITDDHHTTHDTTSHESPDTPNSSTLVGPETDMSQILDLLDSDNETPDTTPGSYSPTPDTADILTTDLTPVDPPCTTTLTRVCVIAHSPSDPTHIQLPPHNQTISSTDDTYPNDPILAMPVTPHIPHACNVPTSLNDSKTILYQAISHIAITPEIMHTIDNIHTLTDIQLTQQFITGKKRKAPTRRLSYDMDPHTLHLTTTHGHTSSRWAKTYQRTSEARSLCISHFDTDTPIT